MPRTAEKVESLAREDGELLDALEAVLDVAEDDGAVEWSDVSDEMTSGQWGRLIEKGLLVDADGSGFVVDDPEGVRDALTDDEVSDAAADGDEGSSWSSYDKLAGVGALGMMAGYSLPSIRNAIGGTLDALFGPLEAMLPFYVVVMVLAMLTGLYSTLLQANLMDMDKMSEYQEQMKEIQERRKEAKERGDEEALDRIQQEQMDAMGDQMGMFKEQIRPMVWIMLLTIPVFLWMYWLLGTGQIQGQTIVLPLVGDISWRAGILGPLQAWIVWYFLCSMGFTQIIRKALNIQTTPT
ncbi:DUF106 domain-containing protein [Halorientalis regularis]|jgi:uncharacterized membrane protein (DUF106 family)|uniref:Uncharacterized membrane protein, DUF106 family n=1 Tax=Halorientalis regularis TaxID=660518 RepID=A0A1G7I6W1_9EURY|nr:DUF106 domain-containing protein [Halorientalis regularis]SDF08343.1 Uncharacterized membrane protein, DUF106 family [Halorientalis regularis]